ncbi:hypothetical protein GW17_00010190 [Ensete ventricosum]|nr:hypothetical protein GW17_00010190 [Ensete ventricosum]
MLPLRFPNSGIRAKVFMQKIGFKLRVMRLNRVKSFYAFLLRFCSKRSEEEDGLLGLLQGRPTTAWPLARGQLVVANVPYKGATRCCGQGPLHRGRPAMASPQGRQAPVGTAACSAMPAGATGCQLPTRKGLLARDETAGAAPARGQVARVGCEATGATSTRGQPAEGRRPPPVQG